MKVFTVNFEDIVKTYIPYVESVKSLENDKNIHIEKIEKYKAEMQEIISSSQTLILDESVKKEKMEKFGQLQNEASKIDNEFRSKLSKKQDDIMKKVYSEISEIIKEYSSNNSIDMVINNTEVIYYSINMDMTDVIIDIIKSKNLYTEDMIKEKETV